MKTLPIWILAAVTAAQSTWSDEPTEQTFRAKGHTKTEIADKQARLSKVLDELESRDTSHLSAELQAKRAEGIARLRAYAKRGVFPENIDYPGRGYPYFIDHRGTRCALAHMIDVSGEAELLKRLAQESNNKFLSQLQSDRELLSWIEDSGFTQEEIAYIQGPSNRDGPVDNPEPEPNEETEGEEEEPTAPTTPRTPNTTGSKPLTERPKVGPPQTTPRSRPGLAGMKRARTKAVDASWREWWDLNRESFVDLRDAYHGSLPTTAAHEGASSQPFRPTTMDVAATLIPIFQEANGKNDEIAIAALVAMARCANPAQAEQVVTELKRYLRDRGRQYREYALLALGLTKRPSAQDILQEILLDSKAGRRAVKQTSSVSDRYRAFAAIALGQIPSDSTFAALKATLENRRTREDVQTACLTGLGLIAADPSLEAPVTRYLLDKLQRADWNQKVLAHIPTALSRTDDPMAEHSIAAICERFLGPTDLRQSAALAFGHLGHGLDSEIFETLVAMARRDVDSTSRRFAIISLGELAYREDSTSVRRLEMLESLAQFYSDSLDGLMTQRTDIPWHAISSALFLRRHPTFNDSIAPKLQKLAQEAKSLDTRAACTLALGIARVEEARPELRRLVDREKSPTIRGYAAEALGLLADRESLDRCLDLASKAPSHWLRHRASYAVGLLGVPTAIESLCEELRTTNSDDVRGALTRAIGEIGDKRSIPTLASIASDKGMTASVRGRAIAALGFLGQKSNASWTARIKRGCNFTATTPSLKEVLQLF